MNNAPIIGLPCRYDTSGQHPGRLINAQNNAYIEAIVRAGGAPYLIPLQLEGDALRAVYNLADGILLTGGGDIDPAYYRQASHPATNDIQADRDRVEISIARWAAEDNKPLLGICRGIQVMAVAVGGALYQDIQDLLPQAGRHDYFSSNGGHPCSYLPHQVKLTPDSRLAQILQAEEFSVNSLHHQAVQRVPEPYQITGYAGDNIPEALELPGHPCFCGVQWHPEELVSTQGSARKLFAAFVDVCRESETR
ncbi:MAG TPA: gamma-glutamyl-gamma-aminobutyrate hydrolase family protein [Chloroflexi bacterium]|nr:gamma-glutamyl-gamma-aminobutyrate hydrolase family protein [Chloroflexota bacterium]